MLHTYYTLARLAAEWKEAIEGATLADAFSQQADELTLAFDREEEPFMLRLSVDPAFLYIFRIPGYSKKKRNVASVFEAAHGRRATSFEIAERDRYFTLEFDGGWSLRIPLFGSRANVFLANADGLVEEAFRSRPELVGSEPPAWRSAPSVGSFEQFDERWRPNSDTLTRAVARAFPLFDATLAAEVAARSGVECEVDSCTGAERQRLFETGRDLISELEAPDPRIYWQEERTAAFSLVPLTSADPEWEAEPFESVDAAVRIYVRRRLGEQRFDSLYDPIEAALSDAAEHHRRSAERMMEELTRPSRAERHERYGHLLMAAQSEIEPGTDEVVLPDLFADGEEVTIALDPAKTGVQNAQAYYEKARRTRRSREEAENRLDETIQKADDAGSLLEELQAVDGLRELEAFRKEHREQLARYTGDRDEEIQRVPFRRFDLGGGYEVWVGRNARQNDELTFRHAQKYDLWMHARGVPGSHAVLRLPNRDAEPGRRLLHRAAAIAAYYSKARGTGVAPVMIARRKHVRSPKGGAPGAVFVEHEEVLLVEPGLPG